MKEMAITAPFLACKKCRRKNTTAAECCWAALEPPPGRRRSPTLAQQLRLFSNVNLTSCFQCAMSFSKTRLQRAAPPVRHLRDEPTRDARARPLADLPGDFQTFGHVSFGVNLCYVRGTVAQNHLRCFQPKFLSNFGGC